MKIEDTIYELVKQLRIRNYSLNSIKVYESSIRKFLYHFKNRLPSKAEVEDYLLSFNSSTYQKHLLASIKNLNKYVLNNSLDVNTIANPKVESRLPEILSAQEMQQLFNAASINSKHLTIIAIIYSAGLRVSEVINLKWKDIDRARMVIIVRQGKGKKDRQVMLNEKMLQLLEKYYTEYKSKVYVFNGQSSSQYTVRSIQELLKKYVAKAGIKKNIHPHSIRHSALTEMFNNGTDSKLIQEIAGHKSQRTTSRYLHLSTKNISNVKSPLEDINF